MIEFSIYALIAVLLLAILKTRHEGWSLKWVKNPDGKGILYGLILAPLVALLISVLAFSVVGCAHVDVYAGLEQTKKISPNCEAGGASDRITSNLGVEGCAIGSKDGRTYVCGIYRHHSCAISIDREDYDAFGFNVRRRIYVR